MNKYRKALKGYTAGDPRNKSDYVSDIMDILSDFGADEVLTKYETVLEQRFLKAIEFKVTIANQDIYYKLPIEWAKTAEVLKQQKQYKNDLWSYKTALFNIREWLDAQLALIECHMVEIPQVFLPYMQTGSGKTVYEAIRDNGFKAIGMS